MNNSNSFQEPTPGAALLRRQLVWRMLRFLRPVRTTAIVAGSIIALRITVEVFAVYCLSPAVTSAAAGLNSAAPVDGFWAWLGSASPSAQSLRQLMLWAVVTNIALGCLTYLRTVWDMKLSMHAVYHIRNAMFSRLQSMGFQHHDRLTSGHLINLALSDLQSVRIFVNMSLLNSIDIGGSVLAFVVLLTLRSPWLAVGTLLPLPFWFYVIQRFSRRAQPQCLAQQEAADAMMSALTENVAGAQVVRAFGTEASEMRKYGRLNSELLRRLFAMADLQQTLAPLLRLIATAAHIGLFAVAAQLIRHHSLEVGDLMILGIAMGTILTKLQQINLITEAYQRAIISAQRFFAVLDLPDDGQPQRGATLPELQVDRAQITLDDVHFGYGPTQSVLVGIAATVPGGKLTALIGPTGSGKSTLINLIARFYSPTSGRVHIDGQDIAEVSLGSLRRAVGVVMQETFLFSETIRDNIRYGRADVSDEMIAAAARMARATEFILGLPEGFDTLLGEDGVLLSGGQRQRLALARALVYDPRILILDDATSALDSETEQAIHELLKPYFAKRTVLVIAHRICTLQAADQILVLDEGRLVQRGTHDELLQTPGYYAAVAAMQTSQSTAGDGVTDETFTHLSHGEQQPGVATL